eukprot:scaffold225876_cov39-Tisochrysis_lutea.AAC.1
MNPLRVGEHVLARRRAVVRCLGLRHTELTNAEPLAGEARLLDRDELVATVELLAGGIDVDTSSRARVVRVAHHLAMPALFHQLGRLASADDRESGREAEGHECGSRGGELPLARVRG